MTIKTWRRLAIVASVFNVVGAVFALASREGWHAGVHISLALGFGFAAQRLGEIGGTAVPDNLQTQLDEQADRIALQSRQLAELEERLDFTERMLAQARDKQKLDS